MCCPRTARSPQAAGAEMEQGRIIQGRGGLYTVRDGAGEAFVLRAKNKFRRENMKPLVGDLVDFIPGKGEEHGWVEAIHPRKSYCLRPPVANITQLVITLAAEPEPDLLLADKLLVFAAHQRIEPLMAVNKADLNQALSSGLARVYQPAGIKILAVSARSGAGLGALREAMLGHITCFAGQSGVGKSTLIAALTGERLETGDISRRIRRGKQTTRHISLIEKNGLQVLDTPGFSLLDLPGEMPPEDLRQEYPDFAPYAHGCRFAPCLHGREPGCAVSRAADEGLIDRERLERYRLLLRQAQENWRERYD